MVTILTETDFANAAKALNCEVAAIKAVAEVESPGGGFLLSGRPKILFEAHKFSKHTGHRYDSTHSHISSLKWNRKLYKGGEAEYSRLDEAVKLDKAAALKSASWGKFQILGENFRSCGFKNVFDFVNSMYISESEHLKSFVQFILSEKLDIYLRNKDWAGFALRYNGEGYRANKYDIKMELAYMRFKN